MKFEITNIDSFIKNHNHREYCEALILADGSITYAVPSHQGALMRLTGIDSDALCDMIPMDADFNGWLMSFLGTIAVRYEGYSFPIEEDFYIHSNGERKLQKGIEPNKKEQLNTLSKLIDNGLIRNRRLGQ